MARIDAFIHRKILVLHSGSPMSQAARAMKDRRVGSAVVSDNEGHIVGIITDRDLVTEGLAEGRSADTPIELLMTPQPLTASPAADVEEIVQLMETAGVRRIPIVEKTPHGRERCVGLVSLDDLIAARLVDYYHLMRIVRAQVLRRVQARRGELIHRAEEAELKAPIGKERLSIEVFERVMSERIASKLGLSSGQMREASEEILRALVRRLHHTGAMHLISQLPLELQRPLLEQSPGPDRHLTVARLRSELEQRFQLDQATAHLLLNRFGMALEELIAAQELQHIKAQLPKDFQALFAYPRAGSKKMEAA